jgi:hypothetical protein
MEWMWWLLVPGTLTIGIPKIVFFTSKKWTASGWSELPYFQTNLFELPSAGSLQGHVTHGPGRDVGWLGDINHQRKSKNIKDVCIHQKSWADSPQLWRCWPLNPTNGKKVLEQPLDFIAQLARITMVSHEFPFNPLKAWRSHHQWIDSEGRGLDADGFHDFPTGNGMG